MLSYISTVCPETFSEGLKKALAQADTASFYPAWDNTSQMSGLTRCMKNCVEHQTRGVPCLVQLFISDMEMEMQGILDKFVDHSKL